jgi:hypothetical protein
MPKPAACPAPGGYSGAASSSSAADCGSDIDADANRRHGAAAHASRGAARTAAARGAARTKGEASPPCDTRLDGRPAASLPNERAAVTPPNGHAAVVVPLILAAFWRRSVRISRTPRTPRPWISLATVAAADAGAIAPGDGLGRLIESYTENPPPFARTALFKRA